MFHGYASSYLAILDSFTRKCGRFSVSTTTSGTLLSTHIMSRTTTTMRFNSHGWLAYERTRITAYIGACVFHTIMAVVAHPGDGIGMIALRGRVTICGMLFAAWERGACMTHHTIVFINCTMLPISASC